MSKQIKIEDAPELSGLRVGDDDPEFPFIALNIKILTSAGKNLNCDLFIKISESKMTRVFSVESGLDFIRLRQYMEKGVAEVFVRREDWANFNKYLQNSPSTILQNEESTSEEKVKALLAISEQNVADFFSKVPVPDVSVEKTKTIVRRMVKSLAKEPGLLAILMRMAQHHDFMLSHAVSVSIISMLIARGSENANEKMLEICGAGGFLHDIGKTQISSEIVTKYNDLSPEQWREMRTHPLLGVKMLEKCRNVSEEVKLIIMQHHEQPDGGGYPGGLRGQKIFYPAKIVAVADAFAAMVCNKTYNRTFTPEQAIAEIQQVPGKFDRDLIYVVGQMFKLKL